MNTFKKIQFGFLLLVALSRCVESASLLCDYDNSVFGIYSSDAFAAFKGKNPSFKLTYPNVTSSKFYTKFEYTEITQENDDGGEIIDLSIQNFTVQCQNNNDTSQNASITFTSKLPNNSTLEIFFLVQQNMSHISLDPETVIDVSGGSVYMKVTLKDWKNVLSEDTRVQINCYVATSVSALDITPQYYDSNILAGVIVPTPQNNIDLHFSRKAEVEYHGNSTFEWASYWATGNSLFPITGTFHIQLPSFADNSSVSVASLVEFAPYSNARGNEIILLIAVSISIGIFLLVILIASIVICRNYKELCGGGDNEVKQSLLKES